MYVQPIFYPPIQLSVNNYIVNPVPNLHQPPCVFAINANNHQEEEVEEQQQQQEPQQPQQPDLDILEESSDDDREKFEPQLNPNANEFFMPPLPPVEPQLNPWAREFYPRRKCSALHPLWWNPNYNVIMSPHHNWLWKNPNCNMIADFANSNSHQYYMDYERSQQNG